MDTLILAERIGKVQSMGRAIGADPDTVIASMYSMLSEQITDKQAFETSDAVKAALAPLTFEHAHAYGMGLISGYEWGQTVIPEAAAEAEAEVHCFEVDPGEECGFLLLSDDKGRSFQFPYVAWNFAAVRAKADQFKAMNPGEWLEQSFSLVAGPGPNG